MAEVSAADRALVRGRALGRCEYCRLPESSGFVEHQIDHIIAIKLIFYTLHHKVTVIY